MGDATDVTSSGGTFVGSEAPKRRPKHFVHWQRPKSQLYEYNYDYGSNYYRPMLDYLDQRAQGGHPEQPKAMSWEERALRSYMDRGRISSASKISKDAMLLQSIRSTSNRYIAHTKTYISRRVTGF
jgi:hypothetical protein